MSRIADGGDAQYAVVFHRGAFRTATRQAQIQLFCIAITLGIAVASGLATGILLRLPIFTSHSHLYNDHEIWEVPEEAMPLKHLNHDGIELSSPVSIAAKHTGTSVLFKSSAVI